METDAVRFLSRVPEPGEEPGEPCESCGRRVWRWESARPEAYPGGWAEVPPPGQRLVTMGIWHDPERCRWWRGDPSTSWGEPPPRSSSARSKIDSNK